MDSIELTPEWQVFYWRQFVSRGFVLCFHLPCSYSFRDFSKSVPLRDGWAPAILGQSHQAHHSYCADKKKKRKTNTNQSKASFKSRQKTPPLIHTYIFFLYRIITRKMAALKTNRPAIISVGITISNNVSVSAIFSTPKFLLLSRPAEMLLKIKTKSGILYCLQCFQCRSAFSTTATATDITFDLALNKKLLRLMLCSLSMFEISVLVAYVVFCWRKKPRKRFYHLS